MIADDPRSARSSISAMIADELRYMKTRLKAGLHLSARTERPRGDFLSSMRTVELGARGRAYVLTPEKCANSYKQRGSSKQVVAAAFHAKKK